MTVHPAISTFSLMTATANALGDVAFREYGGAAVGKLEFDEDSKLHFIPVVGMIQDIEVSKTHVWEDGRVEKVYGG